MGDLVVDIGRRIDQLRIAVGIQKKIDFARKIGAIGNNADSSSYYSQIISGKSRPKIEHLHALAKDFKVSVNWVLTGEGDMFTNSSRSNNLMVDAANKAAHGQVNDAALIGRLFMELAAAGGEQKKRDSLAVALAAYARAHGVNITVE